MRSVLLQLGSELSRLLDIASKWLRDLGLGLGPEGLKQVSIRSALAALQRERQGAQGISYDFLSDIVSEVSEVMPFFKIRMLTHCFGFQISYIILRCIARRIWGDPFGPGTPLDAGDSGT